jgi:hypothetical protein
VVGALGLVRAVANQVRLAWVGNDKTESRGGARGLVCEERFRKVQKRDADYAPDNSCHHGWAKLICSSVVWIAVAVSVGLHQSSTTQMGERRAHLCLCPGCNASGCAPSRCEHQPVRLAWGGWGAQAEGRQLGKGGSRQGRYATLFNSDMSFLALVSPGLHLIHLIHQHNNTIGPFSPAVHTCP